MSWLSDIARPEIVALKPYEHASWEPHLERLHANELPWRAGADHSDAGLNRYPEPQPKELVARLASLYGVETDQLLVGRGSDEGIDLLCRSFCRAGQDSILVCPPTFGMYSVMAHVQGAGVVTVPLKVNENFTLDEDEVLRQCTSSTSNVKLLFLCSPNNPTGNTIPAETILRIANRVEGRSIVVVDEAYVEFSRFPSLIPHLSSLPQLAIMRTLSKAHGLAGARCGSLIANPEIIRLLRKVIHPYAITQMTVEAALNVLQPSQLPLMQARLASIKAERARLFDALGKLAAVKRVWPSDGNFLLAEFADPDAALKSSRAANLLIREVRAQVGLPRTLRISIGTPDQNNRLLESFQ
jgi:histidinol-phosphate aminotransferase